MTWANVCRLHKADLITKSVINGRTREMPFCRSVERGYEYERCLRPLISSVAGNAGEIIRRRTVGDRISARKLLASSVFVDLLARLCFKPNCPYHGEHAIAENIGIIFCISIPFL